MRDESDILIRLSDALAGFVRNGTEGRHAGMQAMFVAASADGRIQQASKNPRLRGYCLFLREEDTNPSRLRETADVTATGKYSAGIKSYDT